MVEYTQLIPYKTANEMISVLDEVVGSKNFVTARRAGM